MATLDHGSILAHFRAIGSAIRDALRAHMLEQSTEVLARTVRDDLGDTIFGIDAHVEDTLIRECETWGGSQRFTLLAEGLDPAGITFGTDSSATSTPPFRLLVDPIDGTRGLMFDKRSAWCLLGAAPDRGEATRLADVEVAMMVELPTTRQATSDVLWATAGGGAFGERHDLVRATIRPLPLRPSQADTLLHGFASVSNFFQGGKELIARLEEAILARALGPWNPDKAEVYCDQYISSGGQLAELALGRDRFVLDVRPLVHRALGAASSLACRPYDLVTWLVAHEAGCVIRDPSGAPLDAPLDVTTNVGFAGYANAALAARMLPIVREEVERLLGL
ncbi:MAG: inositol monophosphatase [Planctomycetes bacterium]|nr:inositol monophosphatase [Planctomycetota bacterium]